MIDIITYIPDLNAFRLDALALSESGTVGFSLDENSNVSYDIPKIPVFYNSDGVRSVCLVRLTTKEEIDVFNSIDSCERIGICKNNNYIFDEGGESIYNSVYNQDEVTIYGQPAYTPPAKIGVFL